MRGMFESSPLAMNKMTPIQISVETRLYMELDEEALRCGVTLRKFLEDIIEVYAAERRCQRQHVKEPR